MEAFLEEKKYNRDGTAAEEREKSHPISSLPEKDTITQEDGAALSPHTHTTEKVFFRVNVSTTCPWFF